MVSCLLIAATESGDLLIQFRGCQRQSCVTVRIEDDKVEETVTVRLEMAEDQDSRIILNPVDAVIRINNNDGVLQLLCMYTSVQVFFKSQV